MWNKIYTKSDSTDIIEITTHQKSSWITMYSTSENLENTRYLPHKVENRVAAVKCYVTHLKTLSLVFVENLLFICNICFYIT